MTRGTFHSKAYLSKTRNVLTGLLSRTKIIVAMEKGAETIAEISGTSKLTYGCILYHLKAMSREKLVTRSEKKRPSSWLLTEFGQQKLAG